MLAAALGPGAEAQAMAVQELSRAPTLGQPRGLAGALCAVAELAASGLTKRQIAQALFVTPKTVGTHLGHIYSKLGLQGAEARAGLRAVLGGRGACRLADPDAPAPA